MLRSSKSIANRPAFFTCAFCATRPALPTARQLHSSKKTNEHDATADHRSPPAPSTYPPPSFSALRDSKPAKAAANKWGLPAGYQVNPPRNRYDAGPPSGGAAAGAGANVQRSSPDAAWSTTPSSGAAAWAGANIQRPSPDAAWSTTPSSGAAAWAGANIQRPGSNIQRPGSNTQRPAPVARTGGASISRPGGGGWTAGPTDHRGPAIQRPSEGMTTPPFNFKAPAPRSVDSGSNIRSPAFGREDRPRTQRFGGEGQRFGGEGQRQQPLGGFGGEDQRPQTDRQGFPPRFGNNGIARQVDGQGRQDRNNFQRTDREGERVERQPYAARSPPREERAAGRWNQEPSEEKFVPRQDPWNSQPSAPREERSNSWNSHPSKQSSGSRREPSRQPYTKEQASPSRFTTEDVITTREKVADPHFSKRQASKAKDRSRRFGNEEESALLDESELTGKEARKAKKAKRHEKPKELIPIYLPQFISVENLADMLGVRVDKFGRQLQNMGFTETSNDHVMGAEEAGLIAGEYGFEPVLDRGDEIDLKRLPLPEDMDSIPSRPPIVTIMGHVDHGKTTLLDWLRKSSVAASEHGGITQHIGAFSVTMPSGKIITFLDTPGHEAFLSMRERGANVTDIVILVVAADDSVKPQTIEAIRHAKAAGVPIIVAINKVDKEDSNIEKVKHDLARFGVDVEDFGGETQTVCVSGKTGQGMEKLEESVIALGEILDHRADPEGQIEGWVLEATTKKKGRVATVLVTRGTLKPGDIVVAGKTWTRVRSMTNEFGVDVPFATPGTPVEIDGWREHPDAGDIAISAETEDRAKAVVDYRVEKADRVKQATDMSAINESRRLSREKEELEEEIRRDATERGENPEEAIAEAAKKTREDAPAKIQEIGLIIKADVSGSVEAVVDSVSSLGNEEVKTRILRSSFGAVSEFDIDHAAAAGAYILAFNLPTDPNIFQYAHAKNVTIISHNVIYHLVDSVRTKLSDLLPPKLTTRITGEAEIAQIFQINVKGRTFKPVAGCRVKNGVVARNAKVRVMRKKEVVFEGSFDSLKNVKKDVPEMRKGSDCGLGFEGWGEFKVGDQIQCYEVLSEKRTL